jgi:hypothetical protein
MWTSSLPYAIGDFAGVLGFQNFADRGKLGGLLLDERERIDGVEIQLEDLVGVEESDDGLSDDGLWRMGEGARRSAFFFRAFFVFDDHWLRSFLLLAPVVGACCADGLDLLDDGDEVLQLDAVGEVPDGGDW